MSLSLLSLTFHLKHLPLLSTLFPLNSVLSTLSPFQNTSLSFCSPLSHSQTLLSLKHRSSPQALRPFLINPQASISIPVNHPQIHNSDLCLCLSLSLYWCVHVDVFVCNRGEKSKIERWGRRKEKSLVCIEKREQNCELIK